MALTGFVAEENAKLVLTNALQKLLQEDAATKNISVDENKWAKLNDVMYEKSIQDLNTTHLKIEAAVKNSSGLLEIAIKGGEEKIRATSGHKF